MVWVTAGCGRVLALLLCATLVLAQSFAPPAGVRPARKGTTVSILPGGRVIAPLGEQRLTAPGLMSLALSGSGKFLVTAEADGRRSSLTVIERARNGETRVIPVNQSPAGDRGISLSGGLVFTGEHAVWASEGRAGRVARIDLNDGEPGRTLDLNRDGFTESFAGSLAIDSEREILYAADPAHRRVAVFDTRSRQMVASLAVGGPPIELALAPDGRTLYIALARSLTAPREAAEQKPVLSGAVAVADVAQVSAAKVAAVIDGFSATGPSGMTATTDRLFVSDSGRDSVSVINARTNRLDAEIPIRIPGLESLRGVIPAGLAYDQRTGWLLVAETGINAVCIIDTRSLTVTGQLPAGWMPTRVLVDRDTVYVANRRGQGAGPSARVNAGLTGSVSIFPVPAGDSLAASTKVVMEAGGFEPRPGGARPLPADIRHVLLIVKNRRSFDEILGDVTRASNGPVMGMPALARFGHDGYVDGLGRRLSLHHLEVTPNHHAVAARWAFSDNFYADSTTTAEGLGWLSVFRHLARHGISFYRSGGEFDPDTSDTERAAQFIREVDEQFGRGGRELPQFLLLRLPNDTLAEARPERGYFYGESYLMDNDLALGRILEYLSGTKWWSSTAVLITEASADGGLDHIDAHRTLMLVAGPWAQKNYVSHTNASFPGLLHTIFRLVQAPPLNLFDATAADLSDCFAASADTTPYRAAMGDLRVYNPAARNSASGTGGAP